MIRDKKTCSIDDLLNKVTCYIKDESNVEVVKRAYEYAERAHVGKFRASGDSIISHNLAVAIILTSIYADSDTICASLLHDVKDTEDIRSHFGDNITALVINVDRIGKMRFSTDNEAVIEYYKKIIVGMSEDPRVIIIKLANRLHNMRTLWAVPEDKQKAKAKETLEILAPIANHLGIQKIKSELEDLSLRYLKPDVFYDIAERLNTTKLERDQAVTDMINTVGGMLTEHNINHSIKGRSKSIYSIYKKLEAGKKFSDIYDLLALRLLVNDETECYTIIGIIHSRFRPVPKRFKDYIAMPKPNGYQSLHTTVVGVDGYLFEIQIRTHDMDDIAENGFAAHWAYKEKVNLTTSRGTNTDAKLHLFKTIIESNEKNMSSEDFINSVKDELLVNEIYVYTPKGDVFEMPIGATPIDFAYRVHSEIGNTMVGAIVNDTMVPLDYQLRDGDIVKITTNRSTGPSKEWINVAKMSQTKNKIKAYFAKSDKEIYIDRGKALLEKDLRKRRIVFSTFLADINKILIELKLTDIEDLYLNIGNNKYSTSYVIGLVEKDEKKDIDIKQKIFLKNNDNDVLVQGIDNIRVNIASCCSPLPGDEIVGYITKGNGISIHRKLCHNLDYLDNRMINVKWNDTTNNRYIATIVVHASHDEKAMKDIVQKASASNIKIDDISKVSRYDEMVYEIDIWVRDLVHLNNFIRDIDSLGCVYHTVRIIR